MAVETGLWLIVAVMGTAFTFFSLKVMGKMAMAFNMISIALWMGLAIIHAGGMEVSSTATNYTYDPSGTLLFNETKTQTFIPSGTEGNWLSWVFLSLALFNVGVVFRDVVKL